MIIDITFSMTLPTIQPCEEDLFSFLSRSLHLLTSDQWSSYEEEVNAHRELPSKSRGRRNAHVVSENPAWVGHGPTAPPRELFPRLCEHLGKHESRTSRLHVHVVILPEFVFTQVLAEPRKQFPRRDPRKRSE